MEAYGVFEGGGAKGAALAGCLAAAQERGIKFRGVGGTSAGAIVAYLAAIGYTGDELHAAMDAGPLCFPQLLDDQGIKLSQALRIRDELQRILGSKTTSSIKLVRGALLAASKWRSMVPWFRKLGIYDGARLEKVLIQLTKIKLPSIEDDVTFSQLRELGCVPLRIVASDVSGRCAALFDESDRSRSSSAITAVRCSAGYPMLFTPVTLDGCRIVDGGLASNLPSFLFADDCRKTKLPVLLFELQSVKSPYGDDTVDFLSELAATALEASDAIMVDMIGEPGYRIPVQIPEEFDTLRIDLTPSQMDALFNIGYVAASRRLAKWPRLVAAEQAGPDIPKRLWATYAEPRIVEPVLGGLLSNYLKTRFRVSRQYRRYQINAQASCSKPR